MKKSRIVFVVMFIICMMIGSNCYAAWWGTPGYEWALRRGITPIKTQNQLNKPIGAQDYYNVLLKYLAGKGVPYTSDIMQDYIIRCGTYNGFVGGLLDDLAVTIGKEKEVVTPKEYKQINKLIEESRSLMYKYSNLLPRDDLKEIDWYLDLFKYRTATLLTTNSKIEYEYKNNILYELRNTKFRRSLDYGILPMFGTITRAEFLTLMHRIMCDDVALKDEDIFESFEKGGVLIGYDYSLQLNSFLTYSEMLTFLYRFEAYDFESIYPENKKQESEQQDAVEEEVIIIK